MHNTDTRLEIAATIDYSDRLLERGMGMPLLRYRKAA